MDEIRHSPEHFLKEIEKEKQNLNRGHLKIFFGYATGVGKTYAMLKAAHSVKRQEKGGDDCENPHNLIIAIGEIIYFKKKKFF